MSPRVLAGRRRLVVALGLLLGLLAPTAAQASLPLTFDALANATAVSDQFAADGIVFVAPGATGLPLVKDVGALASSGTKVAESQCFACEFVHHKLRAALSTTRSTVTLRAGVDGAANASVQVLVEALDTTGSTVIGTQTVTLTSNNFRTPITIDPPGDDNIAYFQLRTFNNGDQGWPIGIDDVTYTGSGTAVPDVSVSITSPDAKVLLGASVDVPVTVTRFNASNGAVALSATGLPFGVSASFTPATLTGTATAAVLHLTALTNAASSPLPVPVAVVATPAGALSGPGPRSTTLNLVVAAPFTLAFATDPVRAASCSPTVVQLLVNREFGFAGTVALAIDPLPAGFSASLATTTVPPPVDGSRSTAVALTVTVAEHSPLGTVSLTVRGTSLGSPPASRSASLQHVPGTIAAAAPGAGRPPRDLHDGDAVTITGSGFCPGSSFTFGNANAGVTPAATAIDPSGTSVVLHVPRFATTGKITGSNGDGSFQSADAFTVRTARQDRGYAFVNYTHPGVSIGDLDAVYGRGQTDIVIDLCWPFGCNVDSGLHSPLTYLYEAISNAALSGNASCFGIALTSQRLAEGWQPYTTLDPPTATRPWDLAGPTGPGQALATQIRRWHNVQMSSEFIQHWVSNTVNSGNAISMIQTGLGQGHHPLVVMRNSPSDGHVVVALDVRADPARVGGYLIDVSDPNVPFFATENTDAASHHDREEVSVIHVAPDGSWTHVGGYGSTWSGSAHWLVAVPWGTIPRVPTLPTTLSGFLSLIVPFASGATTTTQITDAAGHTLLGPDGDVNPDAATSIPGATVLTGITGGTSSPLYVVPRDGVFTQTLRGTGVGTTGTGILGPGFGASVDGLSTTVGGSEVVTLAPAAGSLSVKASKGGAIHAQLASAGAGNEFGADVQLAGADPGAHGFVLGHTGGPFVYRNGGGAATAAIVLSWGGRNGTPGSLRIGSVSIPAGGSATVAPRRWSDLAGATTTLTVRNARGGVVTRRTVHPPRRRAAVRTVRLRILAGSGTTRVVMVKARFGSVPAGAVVTFAVDARSGRRIVAAVSRPLAAAKARGSRSMTFRVVLPRGAYRVSGTVIVARSGSGVQRTTASARYRVR
jgi:hypothetical protein